MRSSQCSLIHALLAENPIFLRRVNGVDRSAEDASSGLTGPSLRGSGAAMRAQGDAYAFYDRIYSSAGGHTRRVYDRFLVRMGMLEPKIYPALEHLPAGRVDPDIVALPARGRDLYRG